KTMCKRSRYQQIKGILDKNMHILEGYADKNLIAKWKKQGYENLCCLRCIQTRDTNFGTNCICRVPKGKLEVGRIIECTHCGCRGCSG
uniref:Protein BUD31 homolog n=1 Tax=Astyanax mexicanus TaxID=7994 RepID=A0A8B9KXU1_ASTMX